VNVTLPDVWTRRWPGHDGSVWYRIDWERPCGQGGATAAQPIALGIDGISLAGEVYAGDDLLWRDDSLVEPLSRSWNVPRWWLLPASGLRAGVNTVWVRAVGIAALSPGMGALRLGDARSVAGQHGQRLWRQRTVYFINAVLCAMASTLFLLVWLLRRRESAHGWFGLMALAWLAYLSTYLASTPWPWPDSLMRARACSPSASAGRTCRAWSACCGCSRPWARARRCWRRARRRGRGSRRCGRRRWPSSSPTACSSSGTPGARARAAGSGRTGCWRCAGWCSWRWR
jgi:hypothetical protein